MSQKDANKITVSSPLNMQNSVIVTRRRKSCALAGHLDTIQQTQWRNTANSGSLCHVFQVFNQETVKPRHIEIPWKIDLDGPIPSPRIVGFETEFGMGDRILQLFPLHPDQIMNHVAFGKTDAKPFLAKQIDRELNIMELLPFIVFVGRKLAPPDQKCIIPASQRFFDIAELAERVAETVEPSTDIVQGLARTSCLLV